MFLNLDDLLGGAVRPLGAPIDPYAKELDQGRVQRFSAHGHARLVAQTGDAPIQRTVRRFTRNDDSTGLPARECRGFFVETQAGHLHFRSVARVMSCTFKKW
jgi:hypothetical protein